MKRHGHTTSGYALTPNDRWVEAAAQLGLKLPRVRGRLMSLELRMDVQPCVIRDFFGECEKSQA